MGKHVSVLFLLLAILVSCGKNNVLVTIHSPHNVDVAMPRFFLSNQEALLDRYAIIKKIDLYEVLPHLDSLPIEYDSFIEIRDVLKIEAIKYNANRAVLKKTNDCMAQVGYCEAYLILKK
ncbi:MAG: hypothetical protein ACXVLQ_16545 [Bacteriovorax sp.]